MSTSGHGAAIDSMDTTTDPSPGSQGDANRLLLLAPATKQEEPPMKGTAPELDKSLRAPGGLNQIPWRVLCCLPGAPPFRLTRR